MPWALRYGSLTSIVESIVWPHDRLMAMEGPVSFCHGRLQLLSKLYPAGFWKSRDLGVVLQKYESSLCSKVSCCSRSLLDPLSRENKNLSHLKN
ncbi:hypothetical protein BDA96_07G061100 [Sorghum bicolor]|uniref:Uncharacterized protein n=1 Tax=Sorghum bicolor TaxID=4558 RepID=A0A921QIP5_SORBI|nr:hypothetical protein BDA96_07G061100 [Sorghum bicolor]